FAWMLWLP
ncbi:1,4-alpha-glucan branching enzyme GlgB, partial [Haemophilus influenzae]